MAVVGLVIVVEGAGELMFIVRLPDAGGHKRVRVPVCRVSVDAAAIVLGFLAIAAAVDENAAQRFIAAGDGDAVMPTAVGRVVAALVAKGAGFARAQIVIRRFRAEGDVAAD